jgi:DNA-binding transcriptional LysR family regulator
MDKASLYQKKRGANKQGSAMDRFTGLEVFVKVVEGASFVSAARYFSLSPAMVSKHVQTLEQRLGARLLNRTTRRVSPTEVDKHYYERCLHILRELEAADDLAADLHMAPRGLVKITAPVALGNAIVASAVADYLSSYPDVSIDLVLKDREVDLLDEGFDLAIQTGPLPDSSLIARRLGAASMIVCAAPSYVSRYGEPKRPADLADHSCFEYSPAKTRGAWAFAGPEGTEKLVTVGQGRFRANSGEALRMLALRGEGIVLEPRFIVADDLTAGRLVRLLGDYEPSPTMIHVVYPHSRLLPVKVRTFVEFLAARFTDQQDWERASEDAGGDSRKSKQGLRVAA